MTDTQACVTNIHFASSTTHAKCNYRIEPHHTPLGDCGVSCGLLRFSGRPMIQTHFEEFRGNTARFYAAVPASIAELALTLADRLGDRQRHLANDLRLTLTDLALSRADSTRSPAHGLFVAQQTTPACPATTVPYTSLCGAAVTTSLAIIAYNKAIVDIRLCPRFLPLVSHFEL